MGKSSGSGGGQNTNTVVQQQQPNPQFLQAYQGLVQQAQGLAGTPLQQYTGPMVAGFSPNQLQAMSTVQGAQGVGTPFTNSAAQMISQSQTPLWPSLPQFDTSGMPSSAVQSIGNAQQYGAAAAQPIAQQLYPFTETMMGAAQNLPANATPYAALATQPINTSPYTAGATDAAAQIGAASPLAQQVGQSAPGLGNITAPYTGFAQGTAQNLPGQVAPYTGFGLSQAQQLPGQVQPYADTASQAAGSAPGLIASYESPYTQQVTGALQNLFNQQNATQQSQVIGNAAAQGAFGGDRSAVAGALTAQGQALAENPQLAQVLQQGYQSSLGAAQQQAALQAQTGLGAGQLVSQAGLGAGQLGLGAGQLTSQAGLGAGQLGLGAGQLAGQMGIAGGQLGLSAAQTLGQLGSQQGQLQLGAGQLGLQGQATQGQLGLGAGQLINQAGLGQGQLAGQAGGLLAQGLTSQGQLGLGAGQLNLAAGQGYFNEFNQQQQAQLSAEQANAWLSSQGAYGEASLGSQAENQALSGASAEEQMGALQQQLAQEQLNVPYEQFLQQQAYPFQMANFEAPIVEGLGSAAGGTSSTSYPGPSALSQVAGLGLTGLGTAGLLNQTGAFGSSGWLTGSTGLFGGLDASAVAASGGDLGAGATAAGLFSDLGTALPAAFAIKRGGRIGYDDGGTVPLQPQGDNGTFMPLKPGFMPVTPHINPNFIKTSPLQAHGSGPPRPPTMQGGQQPQIPGLNPSEILSDLSTLKKLGVFQSAGGPTEAAAGGAMISMPSLSHAEHHFSSPRIGSAPHLGMGLAAQHPGLGARYDDGGQVTQPLTAAAPLSGTSPNIQNFYQQLTQMPIEQLQELSARVPSGTSQGQLVQRALMAKRMTPVSATPLQQSSNQASFLPLQPSGQQQGPSGQQGFASGGSPASAFSQLMGINQQVGTAGAAGQGIMSNDFSAAQKELVNQLSQSGQLTGSVASDVNSIQSIADKLSSGLSSLGSASQNISSQYAPQLSSLFGSGATQSQVSPVFGQYKQAEAGLETGLQSDINLYNQYNTQLHQLSKDLGTGVTGGEQSDISLEQTLTGMNPTGTGLPGVLGQLQAAANQIQSGYGAMGQIGDWLNTPATAAPAAASTPAASTPAPQPTAAASTPAPRQTAIQAGLQQPPPTPNPGSATTDRQFPASGGPGTVAATPLQQAQAGALTPEQKAVLQNALAGAPSANYGFDVPRNQPINPYANILLPNVPDVGQAVAQQPYSYANIPIPGIDTNIFTANSGASPQGLGITGSLGLPQLGGSSNVVPTTPLVASGGRIRRQDGGDLSADLETERQQDLADRANEVLQTQRMQTATATAPSATPLQAAAPPAQAPIPSTPTSASPAPFNGLAQVENFWLGKGASPQVAKAWAAEVNRESGGDPTKVGDSGTSSGAYQEHGDRQKQLLLNIQNNQALNEMMGGDPIAAAHRDEIMHAPDQATAQNLIKKYFFRPASATAGPATAGSSGAGMYAHVPQGGSPLQQPGDNRDQLVRDMQTAAAPAPQPATLPAIMPRQHDNLFTSPWLALVGAGAGMLASRSPFPGVALGEGLETGIKLMGQQAHEKSQEDVNDVRAQYQSELASVRQQNVDQQGRHVLDLAERYNDLKKAADERDATNRARLEEKAAADAALASFREANTKFQQAKPMPGVQMDDHGNVIYGSQVYNPNTGVYEFSSGTATGHVPFSAFQSKEQAYKQAYPDKSNAEILELMSGKKGMSLDAYGRLVQAGVNAHSHLWEASPSNIGKPPPDFQSLAVQDLDRLGIGNPQEHKTGASPAASTGAPAGQPAAAKLNPDTALQQAQEAIAAGADKDKVIERLKANGIDPSGLQ